MPARKPKSAQARDSRISRRPEPQGEMSRRELEQRQAADAQASVRAHMVEIGRGEQQAGRQGRAHMS